MVAGGQISGCAEYVHVLCHDRVHACCIHRHRGMGLIATRSDAVPCYAVEVVARDAPNQACYEVDTVKFNNM